MTLQLYRVWNGRTEYIAKDLPKHYISRVMRMSH